MFNFAGIISSDENFKESISRLVVVWAVGLRLSFGASGVRTERPTDLCRFAGQRLAELELVHSQFGQCLTCPFRHTFRRRDRRCVGGDLSAPRRVRYERLY